MFNRRDFIRLLSLGSVAIFTPLRRFGLVNKRNPSQESQGTDELYAGFVLLSENEPIPDFVEFPKVVAPDECGVETDSKLNSITKFYKTPSELSEDVGFRIYLPKELPDGVREGRSYTFSNSSGQIYEAWLSYEGYRSEVDSWMTVISLGIQLFFAKPLPMWKQAPVEANVRGVEFNKVDYLPVAGLQTITNDGFIYYWIDNDFFYRLIFEPFEGEGLTKNLIKSLVPTK